MNNDWTSTTRWCENIIIADADHVDRVAFDLIVNFERMLMRRIPQADMARWLDCVALDGGVRDGEEQTQVVLIHDKAHGRMDNFKPSVYSTELDGKVYLKYCKRKSAWRRPCHDTFVNGNAPAAYTVICVDA